MDYVEFLARSLSLLPRFLWIALAVAAAGCQHSDAGAPAGAGVPVEPASPANTEASTAQDSPTDIPNARATTSHDPAQVMAADARARPWPGWRGPNGRGIAIGAQLPDPWPAQFPQPAWTQELGTGWSSPVVVDDHVYVTDRRQNSEHLLAFHAVSGQEVWRTENPVDFDPHAVGRRHGNGPKSTPFATRERVFSLGIAGWLQAVDARTGNVIWQVNLPERFGRAQPLPGGRAFVNGTENVIVPIGNGQGAAVPLFGYTGSVLLAGDVVIVSVGGERGGTVMAFDAADGRVRWKSLDENVSYSSPVLAELGGVPQVVAMTGPRVVGLRLEDGALLWSYPFQIQYDESISTPAIAGNRVLVTGDGKPLTALEIPATGLTPDRPLEPRVAWENYELSSYLSSMLVVGDYVYGMGDDGRFACLRLDNGQAQWSGGNHGTYCSPILAGARLLGLNEDGELAVLAAAPQGYRELGRGQLAEDATWTVPAVVGSRLYVRAARALVAYDLNQ